MVGSAEGHQAAMNSFITVARLTHTERYPFQGVRKRATKEFDNEECLCGSVDAACYFPSASKNQTLDHGILNRHLRRNHDMMLNQFAQLTNLNVTPAESCSQLIGHFYSDYCLVILLFAAFLSKPLAL